MPKITVEYKVTHRTSVDMDVSVDTIRDLGEKCTLDPLEKYGVTAEDLYEQCEADGWSEDDYAVTDSEGRRIVPWSYE